MTKVYKCPQCGSTAGGSQEHILGSGTGDYVCRASCGFVGPFNQWDIADVEPSTGGTIARQELVELWEQRQADQRPPDPN